MSLIKNRLAFAVEKEKRTTPGGEPLDDPEIRLETHLAALTNSASPNISVASCAGRGGSVAGALTLPLTGVIASQDWIADANGPEEKAMSCYYYLEDKIRFPIRA